MSRSIDSSGFQKCIVTYPWLSDREIEMAVDRALKEYYLSFGYLIVMLRNTLDRNCLNEIRSIASSAKSFIKYMGRTS